MDRTVKAWYQAHNGSQKTGHPPMHKKRSLGKRGGRFGQRLISRQCDANWPK